MSDQPKPPSPMSVVETVASKVLPMIPSAIGAVIGGAVSPIMDRLVAAGRDQGRAEAGLELAMESHKREVAMRVADALSKRKADPRIAQLAEQLGVMGREVAKATNERVTLESIVMMALDGNGEQVVPLPNEVIGAVVGFLVQVLKKPKLSRAGKVRIADVITGWGPGQRWRAKRWIEIGHGRGDDAPRHVADLLARIEAQPDGGFESSDAQPVAVAVEVTPIKVYEAAKSRGARITPETIGRWTTAQLAAVARWAEDDSGRIPVPGHLAPYLPGGDKYRTGRLGSGLPS